MSQHPPKTSDLIRNREYERVWQRHCGFLDLSLPEAMAMQGRLMAEQLTIARRSRLWRGVFPRIVDRLQPANFRELAPMTNYGDYGALLCKQDPDVLGTPIAAWARTSGRGGEAKWVPYTQQAYRQLGEASIGTILIATARQRGDVRLKPHDVCVTNLPARPYLSSWMQVASSELFDFHHIPALDETEGLSFQARSARIFQQAMIEGMDTLGAMAIVLARMGEMFASGANQQRGFSLEVLHPRLLWRYTQAALKARREGRHILPRDLWSLKCLQCGGTDTAFYRERIKEYWGVYPHETYACTEVGVLATQAWDYGDMFFIPSSAFLEFIPEADWQVERLHGTPPGRTLLLDELEAGQRYEVVVSSFHGGPFLRYRMHDLIEITAVGNSKLGVTLPQFRFVGRSGDFIDLSGFAGLIDERQVLAALNTADISYRDWVMRKEIDGGRTHLHLYIELNGHGPVPVEEVQHRFDAQIKDLNPEYANIEAMLGFVPLRLTMLAAGTFDRYLQYQLQNGADLAHMKPLRVEPADGSIQLLLQMSQDGAARN